MSKRQRHVPGRVIRSKYAAAAIVSLALLVVGGLYVVSGHAATLTLSHEAELGALQTAVAVDGAGASGGKAVRFGGGSKIGGCIAPAGLKTQDLDLAHGAGDQTPPWPHLLGNAAVIYYDVSAVTSEYASYIQDGANLWNVSPCVDIRVVSQCPAASNCVKANLTTTKDGSTDAFFEGQGNGAYTYLTAGKITMITPMLDTETTAYRRMVVAHEMGHSVALEHRLTVNDIMNWSSGENVPYKADATNLNNILAMYGVQSDATRTSSVGIAGGPDEDVTVRRKD